MRYESLVRDVLFIAVVIVFFAIAGLFVVACERLLRRSDSAEITEARMGYRFDPVDEGR